MIARPARGPRPSRRSTLVERSAIEAQLVVGCGATVVGLALRTYMEPARDPAATTVWGPDLSPLIWGGAAFVIGLVLFTGLLAHLLSRDRSVRDR